MLKLGSFALAGLLAVSVCYPAIAATAAATPAATTAAAPAAKAAAPAMAKAKAPAGPAATGVVCAIAKSGKYVHVQAVNKGTAAVPTGDTFAFVIVGPHKKTSETYTFKADLAAGASVNATNAIKAAAVASCTPTS